MIESINDVLKNIRERFASPFFFSFVVTWIIFNWKVTIELLWYNPALYPNQGDLIRFIESNTSNWQSIGIPLISALVYTTLGRIGISAITELSGKIGEDLNLSITKKGKVPMEKFLTYRNLYLTSTRNLERVIEDESKKIQEYDELNNLKIKIEARNVELEGELAKVNFELSNNNLKLENSIKMASEMQQDVSRLDHYFKESSRFMNSYKNISILNGQWKFTYRNTHRKLNFEETYFIENNVMNRLNVFERESVNLIKFFFYDVNTKKITMHLSFIPGTFESDYINKYVIRKEIPPQTARNIIQLEARISSEIFLIQELEQKNDDLYIGTENNYGMIRYERIK